MKEKLLKEIEEKGIEASKNDPSIYTGLCGIALLHYKMNGERGKVNDKVFELIRLAENPNRHRITFLCGMAGPLSILYKVICRRIASIATLKYVISRLHVFVEFLGMNSHIFPLFCKKLREIDIFMQTAVLTKYFQVRVIFCFSISHGNFVKATI